jgi:L-amino acid N-acyltransferase
MTSWVDCTFEVHAEPILAIFNEAILTSTSLYDHEPRSLSNMRSWFDAKVAGNFPVIGAISASGELMGFASYGTFRPWAGYRHTVEHSVYVHPEHRRKGLARQLMQRLLSRARTQRHHVMIGVIDASNQPSIDLHTQLGFAHAGTLRQAGFKFGRWLDVDFYQLILSEAAPPPP